MLQSVLIPDAVRIKYEHFLALLVSEDHLGVEGVDVEHERSREGLSFNLLQVFNIYKVSHHCAKQRGFVEDHLLSVGQEFSMECEVLDSS